MRYAECWFLAYDNGAMNQHIPIMTHEVVQALRADDPTVNRLIDGTVGGGGHTLALMRAGINEALGIDLDLYAINRAKQRLSAYADRVRLVHGSYVDMGTCARKVGWRTVDAILLDLGASSLQMDDPARGFSFRFDAPLDMRFDRERGASTAADLVNGLGTAELADLLYRYGEERHSRRIARAIVKGRPIHATRQLAELVARVKTQTIAALDENASGDQVFQALRIAVNRELESAET